MTFFSSVILLCSLLLTPIQIGRGRSMVENSPVAIVSFLVQISFLGARTSTEGEYRGAASAAAEVVWLRSLLRELGVPQSLPIVLCDNLGTTYLSINSIRHSCFKHIEIDIHLSLIHI